MRAAETPQICPYTGLRSFTEEESLYFKGRDLQIDQITALLEQNKFLMVTGASGEGKSSLIYAGLIPNARAGFFKAKFTNWVVADFRPERGPIKNMAKAIADKFDRQPATVETELGRGFSSLIDQYTNSEFYIDEEDQGWKTLDETQKKNRKRKAANLLILVDQFEEFFTNPENFFNETPSQDSQVVVNLILETARIAMRRNLPVYIICTMRSDYIGQCSAFRGLPEYIGFSQFFVPRLKRKDLKLVIEEPAILSGNKISQRLIERLVFDLAEGVDQLPILQHALSQIWLAADKGKVEMDLLHYAMVGGMPSTDLPDLDRVMFDEWFSHLPAHQKMFYTQPGLSKVIEIHASSLYENAWDIYNKRHPEQKITQQEAKRIIALTFCCLTKIDNSRAVRNRMSLYEIATIVNTPAFSVDLIGDVLNIYREEGNSFIKPFITEDISTHHLTRDTVLDITHESLIRNWNKLNEWANQEFEFYTTYLDFKKQLDRWEQSKRSNNFLLPIGPLTYFEKWYTDCKPNAGWIRRYSEAQEDVNLTIKESEKVLSDIQEFLKRSARKVLVTRTFMKYGPQRIATVFAIVVMLVLSGFYWYDAEQKANERVIERIRKESFELLESREINGRSKARHLLIEERYRDGSLIPYLLKLDYKNRISLAIESYKQLLYYDKHLEGSLKGDLINIINENFLTKEPTATPEYLVPELNNFLVILMRDNYYSPTSRKQEIIKSLTALNFQQIKNCYEDPTRFRPTLPYDLNMGIQLWLTVGEGTPAEISEMLGLISPLSGPVALSTFTTYYPKGSYEPNGRQPSNFNNGYHTLASLYAALGDLKSVEWCFQQLLDANERQYFELARVFNNHLNILGYLYQYHHREMVPRYLKWIDSNTSDNPPITLFRNTVIRAGYISHLYILNIEKNAFRSYKGYFHPNLFFLDRLLFMEMVDDYEALLMEIRDPNERFFQLAMSKKRSTMFMHKYGYDRQLIVDEKKLDEWLATAMSYYEKIDPLFLEKEISSTLVYFGDGVRTSKVSQRSLFIYPDYRDGWFSDSYHSDYFFNYLLKNKLLSKIYKTGDDLQQIHFWLAKANEVWTFPPPGTIDNDYPLSDTVLQSILIFVEQHSKGNEFDTNLPYLMLANRAFERGDSTKGLAYFKKINQSGINRSADRYEYIEKIFVLNMVNQLCINLSLIDHKQEAMELTNSFKKKEEKAFTYVFMADNVYKKRADPNTFIYLDSAFSISRDIDFTGIQPELDSRFNLITLLSRIGSDRINLKAMEILREIGEQQKDFAIQAMVVGIANEGNYYRARTSIPSTLTESQDLDCRSMIMLEACRKQDQINGNTTWRAMDAWEDWIWNYVDYSPN